LLRLIRWFEKALWTERRSTGAELTLTTAA